LRFRALVLAAGYGTRLAPLTDVLPKPLTPVRGLTPLTLALDRLAAAGCEAVAINLHHLGPLIRESLERLGGTGDGDSGGGRWGDMEIVYSEEPEILGTAGALGPLREFFAGTDAVVVLNGDTLCRWPVKKLLRRHRRRGVVATLFFTRTAPPERFGGGVAIDGRGRKSRVVSFDPPGHPAVDRTGGDGGAKGDRRLVFAGAQVLSPDLLARIPDGFAETVPTLYRPLLQDGAHLAAVVSGRPWYDLGTPRRLRDAALTGAVRPWWRPLPSSTWVAPDARLERGAKVARSVVDSGAVVEAGARVRRCLILPGARIQAGARMEGCVIGFHATVPGATRISRRLVCPRSADATLPAGSSVVEELIYAPLDPRSE
jgi:NDP-sugar pyrophosphorylase family protein